jgi:hypothetical protein
MPEDDLAEPLALRWVEAGVSGLARRRDWDVVEVVEVAELVDRDLEEIRFGVLADGTLVVSSAEVDEQVLSGLADRLAPSVRPPYEAFAARHTRLEWSLAARELRTEEIELPGLRADEVVVALGPEGTLELLVDGEEPRDRSEELAAAADRLEQLGRSRHRTFVVRARRAVGERFALSVDPL